MTWIGRCLGALNEEPEEWLAYLRGPWGRQRMERLKELELLGGQGYRVESITPERVMLSVGSKPNNGAHPIKALFFWGTSNQASALLPTAKQFFNRGHEIHLVTAEMSGQTPYESPFKAAIKRQGWRDLLKSLVIGSMRAKHIFSAAFRSGRGERLTALRALTSSHRSLIYFDRIISDFWPDVVFVSNDHEVDNRALLVLARRRGIKTAYIQHASVSSIFPSLSSDFAFLDGQVALQIYKNCIMNSPGGRHPREHVNIVLTGCQQSSPGGQTFRRGKLIGVAHSSDMSDETTLDLIAFLQDHGFIGRLRAHPGDSQMAIGDMPSLPAGWSFSNPHKESLMGYFSKIGALISANSGIHLEAAINGVPTFQLQSSTLGLEDYYGFIRNNLARPAELNELLAQNLAAALKGKLPPSSTAVKSYSATYGTRWQGREAELVADFVEAALIKGDRLQEFAWPDLFRYTPTK